VNPNIIQCLVNISKSIPRNMVSMFTIDYYVL
jgi:hypothetical protein